MIKIAGTLFHACGNCRGIWKAHYQIHCFLKPVLLLKIKLCAQQTNQITPDLLQLFTKSNHYNFNYFLEVNVMITITITFGQNKNDYNYNYFKVGKIH